MRILFVNQAYAPDSAATAQHVEDLARHLTTRGHGVAVIASRSIYGQRGASLPRTECRDGVHVYRVGVSLFGKKGVLARAVDFGFFYVAAVWKALTVKVPLTGKSARPDVVVTLTTPPFIGLLGVLMRRLRGSRHVYWAMDLYPDVLVAAGVSQPASLVTKLMQRLSRFELQHADRVVALGRCMRQLILDKNVAPEKIQTIGVWSPTEPGAGVTDPAASTYRDEWGLADRFVVQYSGNFGLAHDVQTICNAMVELRDDPRIVFLFAGGGKRIAAVEAFAAEHELQNVLVKPYQPRPRLADLLALADVHLISQSAAFAGVVVPSKLFGILAAGRPSIFVGPADCEVAMVLAETGSGRAIALGDGAALAAAIRQLADDAPARQAMSGAALAAASGPHHPADRLRQWTELLTRVAGKEAEK